MPAYAEDGNRRGVEVELKTASLIRQIPCVKDVQVVPKNSPLDRQQVDLVVSISDKDSVPVVFVQTKSSTREVRRFNGHLNRRLGDEMQRKKWMLERKLILLVGEKHVVQHVSDQEIINSFLSQLAEINNFHLQCKNSPLTLQPA